MTGPESIRTPWWLKHANKVVTALLRLGVPISRHESPVVLTAPGRRTGKPRSTPVTPMTVDGKRYVVNGFPGADWVLNVRAAERVTCTQGRRSQQVRMVELSAAEARHGGRVGRAGRTTAGFSHRSGRVAFLPCPTARVSGRRGG